MSRHLRSLIQLMAFVALVASVDGAVGKPPGEPDTSQQVVIKQRRAVIEQVRRLILERYVFPDRRGSLSVLLEKSRLAGRYNGGTAAEFASRLTEDLQKASGDKHLSIEFSPDEYSQKIAQRDEADYSAAISRIRRTNHGYTEQKILPGNVRYVRIESFRWVPDESYSIVDAAARFLKDADFIVIDLRGNSGGDPRAVQYLLSYFFEKPTELAGELDGTTGSYKPIRTLNLPLAGALSGKPLILLTDGATFSAGEELAYEVKQYRLGQLVGARTAGGANGSERHPVAPSFVASIPYLRLIHPLSKTNWEGVGVEPDVETPGRQAFDQAMVIALERLRASGPLGERAAINWALTLHRSALNPFKPLLPSLADSAGQFGERLLELRGDAIYYSRPGQAPVRLVPLAADLFQVGSEDRLRIHAVRRGHQVIAIEILSVEGVLVTAPRGPAERF